MKQRIFFFTIIIALLSNCKATKTVSEIKESVKVDSIYIYKEKEVVKRFIDTLTIKDPCDSVTGQLKPFKRIISVKQGDIILEGINNEIKQSINLTGYEKIFETKYRLLYEQKVSEINQTKVKYRTPIIEWLIIIILCGVIYFLIRF